MVKSYENNMTKIEHIVLFITLSILILIAGNIEAGQQIHFKGSIQVKTDSSITVNSLEILLDSSTKIKSNKQPKATFDDLKVGDYVRVDAESNPDGTFTAKNIFLFNTQINYQFNGTITALTDSSLTVDSTNVMVDSNTVILTQFHASILISDLNVGDKVFVKAIMDSSGNYLAVAVLVFTNHTRREIEVEGNIESLTDSTISVKGVEFTVGNETLIVSRKKGLLNLSDLSVGQEVSVRGIMKNDSTYLALIINVANDSFIKKDFESEGPISAIDDSSIVVGNVRCMVDSSTVIFSHKGDLLNLSDLSVGDIVEIKALLQDDGTYKAVRIKLENDVSRVVIEVQGTIDSVSVDYIKIGGYTIYVNNQTKIYNRNKHNLSIGDLSEGMFAIVEAYSTDSTYYASKIKILNNYKFDIYLTGAIDNIQGSDVTVKGIVFHTDDNTELLGGNRLPISLSDLTIGQIAKVSAEVESDGSYYASRIRIVNFWRSSVIVEGTIDSISINSISVMGKTFVVDSNVVVIGNKHRMMNFSDLTIGMIVNIKGTVDTANGILKARIIKVHHLNEYKIYGIIDSLSTNKIFINKRTFITDSSTVYYDEFDNMISFDSLTVGQFVEMQYAKTASGENLAVSVEIEKKPGYIECRGIVTSKTSGKIDLSISSFVFRKETVFINADYKSISSVSIQAGQQVVILAEQDGKGNLNAAQVQLISGEITSVDNNKKETLPTEYKLFQNYPNPFNPDTKISFSLPHSGDVQLKIFNIIGQEVTTLVNGPMNSGTHVIDFNAENLASGVYFYILRAGNYISVKKMVLLK